MKQVATILRKDVRYLWLEILASFALLIGFTVLEPRSWAEESLPGVFLGGASAGILSVLLCFSWGIIIVRLVQAERLVGVNQFWTTRPYEWPKLLAAKGLFVLLVIDVPLALAQIFLLHRAHLLILQSMPLLLLNLLLLTTAFVLPVACFAALTGSFVHALLAVLAGLVCIAVSTYLDAPKLRELAPLFLPTLQIAIPGIVLSAVLLRQYSRRATVRSWAILATAPVLLLVAQVGLRGTSLAALGYARSADAVPPLLQLDDDPARKVGVGLSSDPASDSKLQPFLHLPLRAANIQPGTSLERSGQRVVLTNARGVIWQSPWLFGGGTFASGVTAFTEFPISRAAYERLGDGPVSLRIEFALEELHDQPPMQFTVSTEGDRIPGLGFCALDESYSAIECRSAYRWADSFAVSTSRRLGLLCAGPDAASEPAHGFLGGTHMAAALHISPVILERLQLHGSGKAATLCPGTPISFVQKRLERHIEVQMPSASIELKDYVDAVKVK
jgi:hypothetical protein